MTPAAPPGPAGYKTVIFSHGLTRRKEDLLAVAGLLASQGIASVGIDAVDHGARAVRTSMDAVGVGARGGLLYRPKGLEQWSFGVTYRSPVKLGFAGTANFDASPVFRASLPPDGDAKTSIVLPQTLDVGIAFNPLPEWQVELDGNWLGWSSYDRLFIELPGNTTSIAAKNWKDTFAVRVGTEYTVQKRWSGRLGFLWDPTPVPDTTLDFQLPDADRYVLTAGLGAAVTPMIQADLGFYYVLPVHQTTAGADPYQPPIKGRFDVSAWVLGLSVGIALPTEVPAAPPPSEPMLP